MGSWCRITADVDTDTLTAARRVVEQLEQEWSRFLPASDVTRLNCAAGKPVVVRPSTIRLLTAMVHGWHATNGAFDPTLLVPPVSLGSSWHDPAQVSSLPAGGAMRGNAAFIAIDHDALVAQLPPATAIDPGGIGKGLAADIVVADLLAARASGALASIGGDVCARGASPRRGGWDIRCDEPAPDIVRMIAGGAATSGIDRRGHHIIDSKTLEPTTLVREATVLAGTAAWAEVFTKALMVSGSATILPQLDNLGLAARVSYTDGRIERNAAWRAGCWAASG